MHGKNEFTCRLCGIMSTYEDTKMVGNGNTALIQCDNCESILVANQPTSEEIKQLYDDLFEGSEYEMHRREFESIVNGAPVWMPYRALLLRKMERLTQGRQMIEIGGGTGAFGYLAQKRNWNYTDYDVSNSAVEFARRLSLQAYVFDAEASPPLSPQSADIVVMWEVIEHVWNVHRYLEVILEALNPSGFLMVSTPNYRRRGYRESLSKPGLGAPPIHVNFYTEQALRKTLLAAGFQRIEFIQRRLYRPALHWQSLTRHARIALGMEPTKTIYALAYKEPQSTRENIVSEHS